jgi:hypothetical protein
VAAVWGGDIWTSTDGGATWRDASPATSWQGWSSVAADATGTNLVAVDQVEADHADIWTSTDSGLTWTDRTSGDPAANGPWQVVTTNGAGNHLVAVGHGAIWTN